MPVLSRFILAYAFILLAPEVIDLAALTPIDVVGHARMSGWVGGAVTLAAGLASAQRRRLLRVGGTVVAMFFALALAGIYAWAAAEVWSTHHRSTIQGWTLSGLALASILLVWLIFRLRPRDGVASRGYAVLIPTGRR
jgi:hypothetical protein